MQRLTELIIAKRNERYLKQKGAIEFGQDHYPFIVMTHCLFFIAFIVEVTTLNKDLSTNWLFLLLLFLITQAGRLWALYSLGIFWNTKILVLPNADIVKKGPYRFVKHPNYLIVTIEFLIIPLFFQAYITAVLFSFLNAVILAIRIPAEEKALKQLTAYEEAFRPTSENVKKV